MNKERKSVPARGFLSSRQGPICIHGGVAIFIFVHPHVDYVAYASQKQNRSWTHDHDILKKWTKTTFVSVLLKWINMIGILT